MKHRKIKENLLNREFGMLTVIDHAESYVSKNGDRKTRWKVRCRCGIEKIVYKSDLISGIKLSCGCIQESKKMNLTGDRYGNLIVINEDKPSSYSRRWKVRCDCGTEKIVSQSSLRSGLTVSCGCLRKEKLKLARQKSILSNYYKIYKYGAKKRRLVFDITLEEFKIIIKQNCIYCNLSTENNNSKKKANGIDRINNDLGYVIENCVPCCLRCNRMKMDISMVDFKKKIIDIYNFYIIGEKI